ncbi:MAG: SLC13 family permease [bacterium]
MAGFALAGGFSASGLDRAVGELLEPHLHVAPVFMVLIIGLVTTFLTEVTSNTATTAALLPIMRGTGLALRMHPLLFMLPATLSASCAFMLPVATPPNAIIFGSGRVSMGRMAAAGIILNIIGALLITAVMFLLAAPAFDISLQLPAWAVK